ncbi:nonribosomal peptide synthase-like protein [Polyplosphaeria fusca]|uniref:Nonribosomal peptide synthase-like protein n=1 Tax=Polyplosphaeria fusca TaxID=682080 RepID=A0A9P4QSQ9_9PLEO|nr:nonribosomal peptide synthase-like protein [Polyplosphaeria fusca]
MVPTVWIPVSALPLLASGKLDRKRTSQWLVDMSPDLYQRAIPATEHTSENETPSNQIETTLRSIWAHVLNLQEDQVSLERAFLSLGGDSISAMQVMGQCRKHGYGLGMQDILRCKSIPQLASAIKPIEIASHDTTEEMNTPFKLSPIQSLWYQLPNQGHGHFNQSFYLRVQRKTTERDFRSALEQLVSRHSMLRARFSRSEESGWQQCVTDDVAHSYRFRHQVVSSQSEIDEMIEDCQKCLDPENGPLFAADLYQFGEEQQAFMVGHHLVIDLVSWRLLLEELEEILRGGSLLPPALPFQNWLQLQQAHAITLQNDKIYPSVDVPGIDFSYWGIKHQDNTYGNAGHEAFDLDPKTTALFLSDCHRALRTEPVEVLLASLIHSWPSAFNGRDVPAVFNEGHGREPWKADIDVSRTVGWFTTVYPVFVHPSEDATETVRRVKDFRRSIPANGRPYFARRSLTQDGQDDFESHWPWEISFNYLGQYQQLERRDALLQPLENMAGETREAGGTADVGHNAPRFALFEVSAIVFKGRLRLAFTFNRHMQHQDRIRSWIAACQQNLSEIINNLVIQPPTPTLSDFPQLSLTEDRFQSMIHRLTKLGVSINEVEDAYPCSNMQEGLLLSQTKDAGFYAAVTVHEVKLANERVDWQKLTDAWRQVTKRHPILRTIFLENIGGEDGLYDQVVLKDAAVNVVHLECDGEHDALEAMVQQRRVPYDGTRYPPHRFTVCTTASGQVFCCLEISHAIMDGHSMSLIFSDLRKSYAGILQADGPLYGDYISYLRDQPQDASLDYWKSYLAGSDVCSFPVLNDGIVEEKLLQSIRLDFGSVSIPDLQTFCNSNGITLSNIFHAAWALTLSSYVGTNDVTFGYLTSARDSQDLARVDEMLGPIINTLVCRVQMERTQSVLDVLQQVQKDYMDSLPHRHTSLAEVQHALELSGASLFNTALSYRRLPAETTSSVTGLKFEERVPIYDPTEYPVSLNIEISEEAALVDLDYWTDHLSAGQAANVASTFVRAIENIVFSAEQKLSALDPLSGKQWQQILGWNLMPETLHECVHERFAQQVVTHPDAPAIRGFDGDYTYAELDAAAERLAHHLVELGVGPEVFVPTCFDKSSFTVVAMLAVLKAGGAAVPLDAKHPKAALESRVEDCEAQVVLTSATRAEMFDDVVPDVVIVDSVLLDDLLEVDIEDGPACPTVLPHNPAFVIFTSGSTGRPKGVVLEHAAMVTSAHAHGTNLGVGPGTRFLQFASYTFDNSLEEMFTTLQRGGCVCVPSEEQRMNDLPNAIAELGANFMDLTPTVAALLNPTDVPGIKGMALGGEALTKAVIDQWSRFVHLHGQYGPSEASINSAWKDFKYGGEPTNIGRAIGSISWIVDPEDRDRLAPIGCKGELLIEGPILSRGYLKQPEKTAAAFITNPQWARKDDGSERRFYCTGDLVHYTSTGEMMYLGRKDSQVKLNGQRIELGEIEHHLKLNLPAEAQSAVELVNFSGTRTTKALVAFLCLSEEPSSAVNEVKATCGPVTDDVRGLAKEAEVALSNNLPAYYVPSMWVPVTTMPMTTSGKLDRKVLRQIAQSIEEEKLHDYRLAGKSGRAPTGRVESNIARLWVSILNLSPDSVGADDSFFRLGGDSIGAMKLVTASRKEGIVLTVANIFAQPKLAELADTAVLLSVDDSHAHLETDTSPFELLPESFRREIVDFAASECRVFPDAIEDAYSCSRLQEGLIALSTSKPGSYVAQTIYRLPANTDLDRFRTAWDHVVAAEAILRTRIVFTEQCGFLQVVTKEPIAWRQLPDLQDLTETDRHLPATHGGPLTSYTIVGEGSPSPFFVWTAHHAVYDGWSLPALLSKVDSSYRQASPPTLSPVPYSRFIRYLSTIDQDQSDAYWNTMCEDLDAPQFPQLPGPDYKVQASHQLTHNVPISRRQGVDVTMPSMIRAAWGLLLATYSGSDDVLWGETNSGRDVPVPDVESLIGPTITTYPMRVKLDRATSVNQYLHQIQRQSSSALPFQFAGLQHISKISSDAAAACEFQSLLAIVAGDSMKDPEGGLWDLQSTGTIGTNFFNYALIFSCTVSAEGIQIEAHYDAGVVSEWLVKRLLQQFDFIINQLNATESMNQSLGHLDLLNPADQEVVAAWNDRPVNAINKCIHNVIFQDQVLLRPSAIALDAWDTNSMTYRELDERASRLASRLVSLGVKPQTYVPLCFDKSGWTIIAMLAVMKAGAAFVPLDFEAPLLRLREMVSDVGAELILCAPQYVNLCQSIPCKTLVVDQSATERQPGRLYTLPYVQSDTPAYVFFTSGSTGKPKGAIINHGSYVSSSASFAPAMGISSSSRVLQFASYIFDCCLIEILSTLIVGGTVCVPDQASRTNELPGVINKLNINWAALTPSVIRTMQPSQVPKLKTLILVGEAMSQQDLLTWADRVTLGNGYGPTECSVVATVNMMTPSTKPNNLGKAVTARGWVVSKDNHDVLVPLGAVGELMLEGGSVGAGYLNNPEKTAAAFVTNVRWTLGGKAQADSTTRRFYKTGDLVKYNQDGTMLYLGRKDSQAKVRGQRLELSEVEHHLINDALVQNALASVPTSGPCAKRLVGVISLQNVGAAGQPLHLLPTETASFSIDAIRNRVCERLPSYMVPSLWVAVSGFPLMPSGKMDRRRVAQWLEQMGADTYRAISTLGLEPPKDEVNDVERKLQAIFSNVLNLPSEDIRLNQSFLHLGGDSIAAMQVSSQCRAQGLAISVQQIIRSKSVSELASIASATEPSTLVGQQQDEYNQAFELTPIQKVFFETVEDNFNHFNQSVVLRLARTFEPTEVEAALLSLIKIHPMLRARFAKDESKTWQQRVEKVSTSTFRFQSHRVSHSASDDLQPILDQSQSTLDITNGPIFSADLFDVDDPFSQCIGLVAHHLVIDVVSWGIVLEDLQNLLNGTSPPPQSLPFYSWAEQQVERAKSDTARKVLPVSEIPVAQVDYWGMNGKGNFNSDVITEEIELGPKDSMLLLGAQDALATEPLDVFIAAVLESFRNIFSDRPTVTIHNEGHGRETFLASQDLSRTIGWFTTMTPVFLPVPPEDPTDIISTIRWVKDLRERIPDKGRPYFAYRTLTQEGQERFAGHWPAEATFNYLGKMQNLERKDAPLTKVDGITTTDIGSNVPRFSLFEISALVSKGVIKLSFSFNRHMKRQSDIRRWISECQQTLVDAVEQLLQLRPEPSLSDFRLLPLSYNGMSRLSAMLPTGTTVDAIEDMYPVSPMQSGILLSQLKNPDLYAYHCIFEVQATTASQAVNVRKLAEAWQVVVQRHAALRTVFVESLSKTAIMDQIVFKEKAGRISWILECEDEDIAHALRTQQSIDYRDFNTPHRLTVCKADNGQVWAKLEMSHAICDGGSIPIVLRDLARAYDGKISRADRGPLYSDFVAHTLSSSRDADLNYWRSYLSDIDPCFFPSLTDGRPGPHEIGSYEAHLADSSRLQKFCRKHGVTLSNVLQLSWALLLHSYVGATDISFGVVASGRDVPVRNIEQAAGCFVNMLICRVGVADETTLRHLLELLQTDSVNAMSHQSCSLADVQHELGLPALFNTIFTFQRRQLSKDPEQMSLKYENVEAADPGEYHITVNVDVSDEATTIDFTFWKDKICPEQAKNILQTFETIIERLISSQDMEATVGNFDFVPSQNLDQLRQFNAELPPPVRRCVHDLVSEQALLRPRSTKAVEGWDRTFTYQEFDEVTTRLAVHLNSLGVSTETFVPILFEKSSWAIVAMIGIMKAGGAYVPLDPKHPTSRLRELIGDVDANVVLCSRNYHSMASEVAKTAFTIDKRSMGSLPATNGVKPKSKVTPDNAAYCLFTSGTTGKPKGTIVPHQSFVTSAYAFTHHMHMDASSRTFQFASYTFDVSCSEILAALIVGATVCVPSDDERVSDPAGAIAKYKATWTFLTPSVLSTMKPERVTCLKTLCAGGEAVPGPVVERWYKHICFVDGYGPTEASVYAAIGHKSTPDKVPITAVGGNNNIPSGCRLWIVHARDHDRLVPIGSVGELIIEGYTCARGYLGDEVKTAKAFIRDPTWATSLGTQDGEPFHTAQMYKTGDLARLNSDGTVCYIGRKDTQIKLNGQRIELGEIEYHVKSKFPEEIESAVELVAPASRASSKALAVFFTPASREGNQSADALQPASSELPAADEILLLMDGASRDMCKSLENALAGTLPKYMIPTIFVPIMKLPWNSAGKLDRNRLRNMVQNLSKETMAPYLLNSVAHKRKAATETEKKLQKLVCSVLNLPPKDVGLDDSFIRLGGDSVAAMRLVAAAQADNIELSVIDIFQQPKLSDLASKCSSMDGTMTEQEEETGPFSILDRLGSRKHVLNELSEQCRVSRDQIQDAYPASPLQEAFAALSMKQPGAYVAQHVLKLSAAIDIEKFKAAWNKAIQEIDLLRTRIAQTQSGAFIQAVLVEDPISWREASSLKETEEVSKEIPAYLGGQLAAYTIVRTVTDERYLVWTLHHALYDGWSIPFMLQRVEQIYETGQSDMPKVPYTKFIKYLLDANPKATTRFWKNALAGSAPYQFPQKSHSAAEDTPNGQFLQHTAKIAPHQHRDITASTFIRAAWALLLATYTGSNDVIYGETLTGRDIAVPGITDICGPTLTTVPTRVKIEEGMTIRELLQNVSQSATERIPHQHTGLSDIRRLDDDTAAACDFQNLLVIQTGGSDPTESMWQLANSGVQTNYFTYPLVIECGLDQSNVEITAYYHENVVSTWQAQRIIYQLEYILSQMSKVSNVREIKSFSPQDVELVREWNTAEPLVVDETIHSLFLKQTIARPNAKAISAFDGEFTYMELRDLASRLAQELVRLGVGPEKLVPFCLDKSRWAVVAMMGILLAGGGYVPLSPEHPASRHRQIIQDCGASIILCSQAYQGRFTDVVKKVLTISEPTIRQLPLRQGKMPVRAKGSNICYVLYTSGSTGTPKGVIIEHRAIASSSAAICKALHMDSSSRVFQFGSFVFDASVMEILTALTCGATICMPSDQERTTDITAAINRLQATWTCLTPSVANVIDGPAAVPTLKTFASGAEALTPETMRKWGTGLQLLNAYGPTEGSIVAVANDQVMKYRDPANIGRPLESSRSWITDPEDPQQLAPLGAVGELCIEGTLLARGYLNNQAKTVEAFIDSPKFLAAFTPTGIVDSKIYRTGDLVQYGSDGSIRYVGRKDNQVKLAGQRMELGEIEHHLQADKRINQAVVLMPKSGPGKRKLTTVISLRASTGAASESWKTPLTNPEVLKEINDIRDRLSDLVPSYMVPTVWTAVSRIPALASSKLDRKQVTLWFESMGEDVYRRILEAESSSEPTAPATETTKALQEIWAKVLNLPVTQIKLNKSWLSLGGDSITAMQLLARCRKEGINLTLNHVLKAKSITHLSDTIRSSGQDFVQGRERTDKLFDLSPVQQFYFDSIGDDKESHFHQSYTLRITRKVDATVLKNATDAIVQCHSMLRARYAKDKDGAWQQIIPRNPENAYAFKVHDVIGHSGVVDVVAAAQKSLHIIDGPVFSVNLINTRSDQVLFMTAHHLVIDIVSWRVILGDLEESLTSKTPVTLQSELPFQIWCEKQTNHALQPAQADLMKRRQLNAEPADLAFWGLDKGRNVYGDVERDSFLIEEDITTMALEEHSVLRTDIVDIFVASILHSFSRIFMDRSTPTVFNETHGREPWDSSNIDLSRTVGWFTTMYPVHVPISEDEDDVVQTLRRVKDTRRKVADNGRPYFAHRFLTQDGKMRYAHHGSMEILFNYLGKQQHLESDDSLFKSIEGFSSDEEVRMSDLGPTTGRPALFEVSASVTQGKIQFGWMYNRLMNDQPGIKRWINECQRTLQEIVRKLAQIPTIMPSLSDFPLLPLPSYDRLERMVRAFPNVGIESFEEVEDIYPCAAMQEGMIISQLKNPSAYLSSSIFEVKSKRGPLDLQKIADSWQKVVKRHPALRTVFIQSVCRGGFDQIAIKDVDSGALTYTCEEGDLQRRLDATQYVKLNGKKKPRLPHQFTAFQTTSGRVIIKLEINHAVIDGGSHGVIRRDLEYAYAGRLAAEEGPLYSDYIKYIQTLDEDAAIEYWKNRLRGLQPCYFPVVPQHSSKDRELHSCLIDFNRYDDLRDLAERNDITLANMLLAVWALVLRTYTGSSDVCYGYLTSGRNIPVDNVQDAVGAFLNMLVSRTPLSSSLPLMETFRKVQNEFMESLPHQHCSMAQFQHDLKLSGKALFNTAVSIQNLSAGATDAAPDPDIEFDHLAAFDPSEFAITVNIDTGRTDAGVRYSYWTDFVSDAEMSNVETMTVKILSEILLDSNQTIAELDAAIAQKPLAELQVQVDEVLKKRSEEAPKKEVVEVVEEKVSEEVQETPKDTAEMIREPQRDLKQLPEEQFAIPPCEKNAQPQVELTEEELMKELGVEEEDELEESQEEEIQRELNETLTKKLEKVISENDPKVIVEEPREAAKDQPRETITDNSQAEARPFLPTPSPTSVRSTPRFDIPNPFSAAPRVTKTQATSPPRFDVPNPFAVAPAVAKTQQVASRFDISNPFAAAPTIAKRQSPNLAPPASGGNADWANLIRSIVSEVVPQIVDQVLATRGAPSAGAATIDTMTNQMVGMLNRKASYSQSMRGRPNFETGSIRSRRLSTASDAESRINIAADMVAAAGVMATEALKGVPPDFVEKKLLTLWSELLDMVEGSIDKDDSFFQLGGDSIIAMRLVGAAREEGLSMTVADVFRNPTFADMTRVVRVAGEVIDQVMSQAGGDSSSFINQAGPSSIQALNLRERAASAFKDFQSVASEHAIDDEDDDGRSITKESLERSEQMFKKWQGFASSMQSGPPQRAPSIKRQLPSTVQTIHEDPSANKSVSLLGDPNVDNVISKVQVFKGGIVDVLPVTDFQSLAITGALLESRWMLNYFYLDGSGPLDLRKLKQTAFRIVQAFDILRTVFVPYGDRFLQVVLRKLQPDFLYQETDLELDDFTTELRQKDREHGPKLGESFVQFVVAKQRKKEYYRIFMRLSHAQYDGYCIPKILGALQDGYNGLPVSSAPSFGAFVRESAKTIAGAHDHWREVLRGSKMTEIVHHYGPNYQRSAGRTVVLKQTLTVPSLSHINITTATVMKAAWAATLARIASSSDIVFGSVISGRNGSVPNVESIIGPCLNMVPIRVVYRPEWTVADLLAYIQEQQIANMPYESLGFREITRNCTNWPDWTNFSSVIQHNQNIHAEGAKLQLGGIEYEIAAVGSQEDFADFSVTSTSKGGDQVETVLTYAPNTTITAEYAQDVFDILCTNVITFAADPFTLLPSPSEMNSNSSTTIASEKDIKRKKSAEKAPLSLPSPEATGISKHEIHTLAARLRSAWSQILRDDLGQPVPLALDSDFFQLGGDIMGLAQVASILGEEGLRVRVEDLIDKCVFNDQVGVLAEVRKKVLDKEDMSPWGEKVKKVESRKSDMKQLLRTGPELERRDSGGLKGVVKRFGMSRKSTFMKEGKEKSAK